MKEKAALVFNRAGMIVLIMSMIQICFLLSVSVPTFAKHEGVTIENPQIGKAEIAGDSGEYYYLQARIKVKDKTSIVFKQKSCVIVGSDRKEYLDCWIRLSGWSGGISESKSAPISMRTLSVKLKDHSDSATHDWNTSKIDGPKGAIEFTIPDNGFIDLYFLWSVPTNFKPKKVKIEDIIEINL